MFLKPANSDMENGFKKIKSFPWKKFIYSGNWKLEKTRFDRHKNNAAIGVDYLTLKKKIYTVFYFKTSRSFFDLLPNGGELKD